MTHTDSDRWVWIFKVVKHNQSNVMVSVSCPPPPRPFFPMAFSLEVSAQMVEFDRHCSAYLIDMIQKAFSRQPFMAYTFDGKQARKDLTDAMKAVARSYHADAEAGGVWPAIEKVVK